MTTRNAEAVAHVSEVIESLGQRPWALSTTDGILFYPSFDGGAEWGGSAYDPIGHKLILNAQEIGGIIRLYEIPVGFSNAGVYAENCASCHGKDLYGTDRSISLAGLAERLDGGETLEIVRDSRGAMPAFDSLPQVALNAVVSYVRNPDQEGGNAVNTEINYAFAGYIRVRDHEGLPGNTPPWGILNSIDLATGEVDWQVNFGNYPSYLDLEYGAESYDGPIVTASGLIFIGATPDAKFRAYDTKDGSVLWDTDLPAAGLATPAVYRVDGKQYVMIAAGGGRMASVHSGSDYVAFSLPD